MRMTFLFWLLKRYVVKVEMRKCSAMRITKTPKTLTLGAAYAREAVLTSFERLVVE